MTIEKYGAFWCGPCKVLDKTLDEFSKKHPDIKVEKFDIDEMNDDELNYLNIKHVPVLRFMDDEGYEVKRLIGAQPLSVIENELV